MTRWILGAAVLVAAAALALVAWQDPRVQSLFAPAVTKEDPLQFLRNIEIPETPHASNESPRSSPGTTESAAATPADPPLREAPANQVANAEVASVLIQILKARKLAAGISLSVTDTEVAVYGTVAGRQQLDEIAAILEKGREARALNLSEITIRSEEAP